MTTQTFAELDQKLAGLGYMPFTEQDEIRNGQEFIHRYYDFDNRTVRLSEGFPDGLWCSVSENIRECSLDEKDWISIYSLTVPGFDNFDLDQQMDWVISGPRGEAYVDHLFFHINQLKAVPK